MSDPPATLADMKQNGRPRVVLSEGDRQLLARDLETLLGRVVAVEETITLAAWRSGTNPSEWTQKRLDVIRAHAVELAEAVQRSPAAGD